MNPELETLLCTYLGELLHEQDNTFDWIERSELSQKINAVNVLLGIPGNTETWLERAVKAASIHNPPL